MLQCHPWRSRSPSGSGTRDYCHYQLRRDAHVAILTVCTCYWVVRTGIKYKTTAYSSSIMNYLHIDQLPQQHQ